MSKPKIIAFYLPQFHPTPDNDRWWGKGFTEWTNVGKAKPLFKGHYQPKVPADLGYYDLRLPEVREQQAKLAREAGVYGFCYYHYWFGNGKQELEMPFNEVLKSGKPDFPFMLCWANESWFAKSWNTEGLAKSKQLLIEQVYPGEEDIERHFNYVLPAFRDKRYIRIDGRPLFMIYSPNLLPERSRFIDKWQKLAKLHGIPEILFVCQVRTGDFTEKEKLSLLKEGFNYINTERIRDVKFRKRCFFARALRMVKRDWLGQFTGKADFSLVRKILMNQEDLQHQVIPTMIPNWDHTPRSGKNGFVFTNTSPENAKKHFSEMLEYYNDKPFIFLKSWNEWGEGNYMEPDLKYGKGYIKALREALDGKPYKES